METYVNIKNTDYKISNLGNVIGAKGRVLKPMLNKNGYYVFSLCINKVRHMKYYHRMVAEYFLDNFDSNLTVNHIDGDKSNNSASNLECVSYSDNLKHAYKDLKRTVNRPSGNPKGVLIFGLHNYTTRSIAESSRLTGVSETQIRRLINNKKQSKNGFYFKFTD